MTKPSGDRRGAWLAGLCLVVCCGLPVGCWYRKPGSWHDLGDIQKGMTVREARQVFPYDADVSPESNSRLTYEAYLARHGISSKQFRGTVVEGSSGSNLTIVDGTISWSGGDWVNGEPKPGKSAAEYMQRGGRWFVLHDEVHNLSPERYFRSLSRAVGELYGRLAVFGIPVHSSGPLVL